MFNPAVSDPVFDSARLLYDLKRCGKLIQGFSGQLPVNQIAATATEGLVEQFGCLFARIWLTTPDRTALKLVASSGLHTHLDGEFSSVSMGAFKVGKIAQHCISFLSNDLAEESWVKDRDWVIAHQIRGFAGLPLIRDDQALGVLAIFSRVPLSTEFLEILQLLSVALAGSIATAQASQALLQSHQPAEAVALSEQLSRLLGHQNISLIGLEQPSSLKIQRLLLETAQQFQAIHERYCRLIYTPEDISLEMICAANPEDLRTVEPSLQILAQSVEQLQGQFLQQSDGKILKVVIQLPYLESRSGLSEREQEVLELLAHGFRDRAISERLFISERTVKFHVKNILSKLEVKNRVQAVFLATKQGWLT